MRGIADSVATAMDLYARRTEQAEPAVERRAALAGRLGVAAGRRGSAGISYQQVAQGGVG